jgi:hypothetical protein
MIFKRSKEVGFALLRDLDPGIAIGITALYQTFIGTSM